MPKQMKDARARTVQRLQKVIASGTLLEELEAMSPEELRARISRTQQGFLASQELERDDEDLATMKEQLAVVKEPYRTEQKRLQAIASYCAHLLEEKGKE